MLIATGFNSQMAECGVACIRSIQRYLMRYPQFCFVFDPIPEDYDRPASWHKVETILKHLPDHDFVLWVDADTILAGTWDLRSILQDRTLNIAKDHNGINHGVAAWKNCPQAFEALRKIQASYPEKDGPWFEQHALMELEPDLDVGYQSKPIFNAYHGVDATPDSQIIHWPGMLPHDRLPLMMQTLAEVLKR